MDGVALWIVLGIVAVGALVAAVWRFRRPANPRSLEALGIGPPSPANDPAEVARLRQNLRLKVFHDEVLIDRLVQAERERMPTASEVEWYRAAVERWERDNR